MLYAAERTEAEMRTSYGPGCFELLRQAGVKHGLPLLRAVEAEPR